MKKIALAFLILIVIVVTNSFKTSPQFEPVAVIELFTSQGCSSCPQADKLLAKTIADAKQNGEKIFALSFHVDYWNRLGWADPFSDKKYSERQSEYANAISGISVYTPQMVVNGSTQFVGSDENDLSNALTKTLNTKTEASFKNLSATVQDGKAPHVEFTLDGNFSECKINFALLSLSETTSVKRGENGGHTLVNENVVRQFITQPATASGVISFELSPLPLKNNSAIVAFIQRTSDLKIIGAAMAHLN